VLVAHHYTEAGSHDQAVGYWQRAGQQAVERSANVEAISHLRRGLEILKTLPETLERVHHELDLQLILDMAWMVVKLPEERWRHIVYNKPYKEILAEKSLNHLLTAAAHLVHLPKSPMRLDYDEEADVVYIHFEEEAGSTHSEMLENGVILDYKGNTLVGITILEASTR
jgi:uncharacterized protein YuzE